MKILVIGGSGFLSGTITREALAAGHELTVITRGQRPLPTGARAICVDRKDRAAFAAVLAGVPGDWDLVVDCIGMQPGDAEQDIAAFAGRTGLLVFISTDFVYDPALSRVPEREDGAIYLSAGSGYGGDKRACEEIFLNTPITTLPWLILRPCHIYGPGSLLGCLPLHGRDPQLIARLQARETLRLAGGGALRQQPVYAPDIAQTILSALPLGASVAGKLCNLAGPDTVASIDYYRIIADILGVELRVEDISIAQLLAENPGSAPYLRDRVYDLTRLFETGLSVPSTPLRRGLEAHVKSLL